MNRRMFLLTTVSLTHSLAHIALADPDDNQPTNRDKQYGYRYRLITAKSLTTPRRSHYVSNIGGQIGLPYDFKNLGAAPDEKGQVWRGRTIDIGGPFAIRMEEGVNNQYEGKRIAYDRTGKDRSINLEDPKHTGCYWKEGEVPLELHQKYVRASGAPFYLIATVGEFAGYFLDFGEPEKVLVPDEEGMPKDRSYVRRQAILVKEPSELALLMKEEFRPSP